MTHYAAELVRYVAQFGRLSEEEATAKLDGWASSNWKQRTKPPHSNTFVVTLSKEDLED